MSEQKRYRGRVPLGYRPVKGKSGLAERDPYEQRVIQLVITERRKGTTFASIQARLVLARLWPRPGGRWAFPQGRPRGFWTIGTLSKIART